MTARVAVIILAAGRGQRFDAAGRTAKVVALLHGVPLVRIVATTALASRAISVIVVTGQAHAEVEDALGGLGVRLVHNAGFASGIASSLRAGIVSLPTDIDGALVMLADMPLVRAATLDLLMTRFGDAPHEIHAVVPVHAGRRGNPVLIGRRLFGDVEALSADEGARRLLSAPDLAIERCEVDDPGVTIDVDTSADLQELQKGGDRARVPTAGAQWRNG